MNGDMNGICQSKAAVTEFSRTGICDIELRSHLARCPACEEWLDSQTALQAALHRLAGSSFGPGADVGQAVMAAFQAKQRTLLIRRRAAIAAALVFAGLLGAIGTRTRKIALPVPQPVRQAAVTEIASPKAIPSPPPATFTTHHRLSPKAKPAAPLPAGDAQPFVAVPYTLPLADGERAWIVRMQLPPAALLSAGFPLAPGITDAGPLDADVVVGEDGRARAIRLISAARLQQLQQEKGVSSK